MIFGTRTEPDAIVRNRDRALLVAILLLAAALRLWHLDFGLPSLNDPDEPIFVTTALDMLREGRLNPGWFGHPATLLFYLLAIVAVAVGAIGAALGAWSSVDTFVAAVFANPGILVLPMRGAMAALGVASVWMTWRIGRRIGGTRTGQIAALLLACNPLHVELSQTIRTDMLATLLMGWSLLHALAIARNGRLRDHLWAGVAAGLACATKWPALLVLVAPLAAGLWAARNRRGALRLLPIAPAVAVATLLLASPYLLLDYPTVLRDLGGEARPAHLGATGHGLFGNLAWYLRYPLLQSLGLSGLALAALGILRLLRDRASAMVLLPVSAVLLLALSAQALVWARWLVPLLPIASVLAALGLAGLSERPWGRRAGGPIALVLAGWMAHATLGQSATRANDPRQAATNWVLHHVPPGRTILVEHAAFDLIHYRGRLLFPLGTAGCVDVRALLRQAPSHNGVNRLRAGKAIVDVGNVDPALLETCKADILILSNFARYRHEPMTFAPQLASYRRLVHGYTPLATFAGSTRPVAGDERPVEIFGRTDKR